MRGHAGSHGARGREGVGRSRLDVVGQLHVSNAHARLRVRDRHLDDVGVRVVVQQHDRALRRVHKLLEHALRRRHLRAELHQVAAADRQRARQLLKLLLVRGVHRLHDAAADVELLAHQFARVVVQLIVLRFEGEGIRSDAKKAREARPGLDRLKDAVPASWRRTRPASP